MFLSILVPTFRRPEDLGRLLPLLQAQAEGRDVEILVIDNSPEAGARAQVTALGVRYLHAATPGVAHARNLGIAEARGEYLLFIDDDELPGPDWLANWLEVAGRGPDAAFGPVRARFDMSPDPALERQLQSLFSRDMGRPDGAEITDRRAWLGTGNALFHRRCFPDPAPFDPRFNAGGEDVSLLRHLVEARGMRLFWSARTEVSERVPAARMTAAYLRGRRFRNGQLRCIVEAAGGHRGRVLFWMGVGLVQVLGHGAAMLALMPFDRGRAAASAAKAAAGLGKIFWWRG